MLEKIMSLFSSIEFNLPFISALIVASAAITFAILERVIPYNKPLPLFRKGVFLDFVWYTLIHSKWLEIIIFVWVIDSLRSFFPTEGILSHWPIWALVVFFFVTHDFYIYWFHRWQHHNKWLWRTHEAHHSTEHVDFIAGSRSHAIEILINQTIEFAPIMLLLDAETAITVKFIKGTIDAVYGQFIHANINVNLGKLGYIFNGPILHQWHHAENVEVYHANFATKLSLWDYIFGTAYNPNRKPEKYGVWYRFPRDYFGQHLFAIFRYNVEKVESNPIVKFYLDFRINMVKFLLKIWEKIFKKPFQKNKLIEGEVYAPKPELVE